MKLTDSLALAWSTIRSNKLRTGITVAIIALGIMALIGISTAIEAMNQSLRESFSVLGANSFTIRYKARRGIFNNDDEVKKQNKNAKKERKSNIGRVITYQEARQFKESFNFPGLVSISVRGSFNEIVQHVTANKLYKTNPNVSMQGGDENYLELNGVKLLTGRNFSDREIDEGSNVVILGYDILEKCFEGKAQVALGKMVKISNRPYLVIGVMDKRGASAFLNLDNLVVVPYNNIRRYASMGNTFSIACKMPDFSVMDAGIGEATGLFRKIRKLDVKEDDNFAIDKSDAIAEQFIGFLSGISGSAGAIGFITLVGAAIGLMNIMLVAVTERTKEVGLTKALGATRQNISRQFLFESILLSLLGAFFGIVAGILIGNVFAMVLDTGFVVPWKGVISGVVLCFLTGLGAGFYPARKASKLDPIVALRYE